MEEPKALLELQEADLAILRAKKRLENLPQREKILNVRAKRAEVQAKSEQVFIMRAECDRAIRAFQGEDTMLQQKSAVTQKRLAETTDFRLVTSVTKEIEGFAKRREKIDFELTGLLERSDKIAAVEKQVATALSKLSTQEDELVASFRDEGGMLQSEIARDKEKRDLAGGRLSAELFAQYEKCAAAKGGVGAAVLQEKHCSVCRVEYHDGQLAKLSQGPDIATCPNCHRLLIVRGV